MRIIPPKTKKKLFNRQEFKTFLFDHQVVGTDKPIPFRDFLESCLKDYGQEQGLHTFLTMLPHNYHYMAEDIIREEYALEIPISDGS